MKRTKKTDVEKERSLLTLGQCVYRNSMPGLINARARLEKSCPWFLRTILQGTKGSSISIPSRYYQGVLVPHNFAWLTVLVILTSLEYVQYYQHTNQFNS